MRIQRPAWIVIHGTGGSFLATLDRVASGFDVAGLRGGDELWIPRHMATVFQHMMQAADDNPHVRAVRLLLAARILTADTIADGVTPTPRTHVALDCESVENAFAAYGLPVTPAARFRRAAALVLEADRVLAPLRQVLREARPDLIETDGSGVDERTARSRLAARMTAAGIAPATGIEFVELLRDMHDSGGDLDTVAAAALHAYVEVRSAGAAGREIRYGRDYRFVFLNYHQSFVFAESDGPADILAADLPLDAFPSLPSDVRRLAADGVRLRRFEDHHPYTPGAREAIEALRHDGLLEVLDLSGPLKGAGLAAGSERCAADMVYANRIGGMPWDNAAARRLGSLAHAEDFVTGRVPESEALTTLIKGGACKTEIAQRLLAGLLDNDLDAVFEQDRWLERAKARRAALDTVKETLEANTATLVMVAPDDPVPRRLLVALAPATTGDGPSIPVGNAVEYFAATRPDLDYVFYCWGSSLMVARRVNQGDTLLNLGDLMSRLGTESDGGHGGAAVCRPALNPHYPSRLLGRVDANRFQRFVRYLDGRLEVEGFTVWRDTMTCHVRSDRLTRAGRGMAVLMLVALLIGWGLVCFAPAFQREAVLASNAGFLEYLDGDAGISVTEDLR